MEEVREKLGLAVRQVFGEALSEDFLKGFSPEVTLAPEGSGADFSSNVAMQLAGRVHLAPREVAEKIVAVLVDTGEFATEAGDKSTGAKFQVAIAGPGFLNFIASDEYYLGKLADFRANFEQNISQDEYSGKTVVCEFSDPNPFKVLHVGHLYTSIVGDAMSRLVEFAGGKVIRANFGGDVGLHVAKTLSMATIPTGGDPDKLTIDLLAKSYVLGTQAYEENEQTRAKIIELNKKVYQVAEKGPEFDWGQSEGMDAQSDNANNNDIDMATLAKLYWRGRELSYQYFEDFYARIGVKFDKYYPESMVAGRGLNEVKAHVGDVYEESDGAVIFPGEKYDLHTRVFINKEGLPTYEAKDVGLIFTKWDDYHFDKSIVITGNDIIDYMKVVLKSVSLFAPELVERTEHITHGNVRLPGNEKMSSRKGNFIRAVDVLDEVGALLAVSSSLTDALLPRRTESTAWSAAPVASNKLATKTSTIALGAIKYAFLKYKVGGNIEFDARESVSTTGNSGVYLQYSAVRAKKILLAARSAAPVASNKLATKIFLNEHEKKLTRKVFEYGQVLHEAVFELAPHKLANYLFEVSQEFSRFYENVKVAGSEEEAMRREMVAAYLAVMEHGLGLLGIEVPEEM